MILNGKSRLSVYEDVEPISKKKNIFLVRNKENGTLYVKKHLQYFDAGVYRNLLEHPADGTPQIFDLIMDDSELVVIEQYIKGLTIGEYMEKHGLFSIKDTTYIAKKLCRIINGLHSRRPSIIHRDIKPSNIIITPEKEIFLLDFNAAKFENKTEGKDTVLIGTVGHAAPEQYGFASSNPQTDVYAMGVLMNIMLSGKLPSDGIAKGRMKPLIKKCLEFNPRDRYRSANALYKALCRFDSTVSRWLPPGFRTMKFYKCVIAIFGYWIIFNWSHDIAVRIDSYLPRQTIYWISLCLMGLSLVAFYCNYLDFQRIFPLANSKNTLIRLLSMVFAPILICGTILLASILLGMVV